MREDRDPIDRLKEQLRREILALVGEYDQYMAARAIGTDQPRMSDLHQGRLERFSLEKMIRLLANIERRVEITVVGYGRPRIFHFPPRKVDNSRRQRPRRDAT